MNRISPMLISISFLFAFQACEKEKKAFVPIQIITDKGKYSTNEKIKVELTNLSDSSADYDVCSSYSGIPPNIYKLKGQSWMGYWTPICNGYSSFCCDKLPAGISYKDTLNISFDKGTYRLEYQFIVASGHEYQSFFSRTFTVE